MPASATSTIRVTFDKSHLVTIGEKLYGESLELLRELIANSYDADAENVWIEVRPEKITVRDDGSGMDESGIHEFFKIGSQNKKMAPVSPRYRRPRVGQFGIGKFAVLSACKRFRIFTQRDGFAGEVVFDKNTWEKEEDVWNLPFESKSWNPLRGNGTTVILEELSREFTLPDIERFIRERLPLTAPHFSIYLNGKHVTPTYVPGRKFPVSVGTRFGWITGELIIPNIAPKKSSETGVECVVRGVVICRSDFGLDIPVMRQLKGRVTADFVPITSDRSRFITDTPEYEVFVKAMEKEIRRVGKEARDLAEKRARQKADQTLKDTLTRMRRAIRKNPDIAPPVMSPSGEVDGSENSGNSQKMAPPAAEGDSDALNAVHMDASAPRSNDVDSESKEKKKEPPPKKIRIKSLKGKDIVARRIMIGGHGITCTLENCGRERPAAFTEGGIIFINMDHPLYVRLKEKGGDMLGF